MLAGGVFAEYQPRYGEHGIPTFPVSDKRPAVSGYMRLGLPGSRKLATKFASANGIGFVCGYRSGITVIDVDSPDEGLLAEALDAFGPTPFLVRSGSGNHQAWYRHHGEGRKIRPDKSRPIDILGGGYVVAPPSRGARGAYSIIQGSLDDLASLPPLRPREATVAPIPFNDAGKIERGQRNQSLWQECMRQARFCPNVEQLIVFARKANETLFDEPLPDEEVLRVVGSAWAKETSGDNLFGRGGRVIISADQIDALLRNWPDAFILMTILRRHHWGRQFVCSNAMAEMMPGGGWPRQRFAAARRKLEEIGEIQLIRPASRQSGPAIYRFKGVRI